VNEPTLPVSAYSQVTIAAADYFEQFVGDVEDLSDTDAAQHHALMVDHAV